ncbi:uncharacterized protein EI90DRAFT_3018402 [Cantharellus anzutake]|uniref:uncharacterized protein n=1 Tax=Cantharellus anzutake TaxID=1750568 RepID=UPI00190434F1|nr:uncharacterized protein EI90DRAFT_3018402 [Cantharellus anzutake]KAF8327040.1 hypothetical protein EI90DRAFT_3018402 [Cantharellus anzutake]
MTPPLQPSHPDDLANYGVEIGWRVAYWDEGAKEMKRGILWNIWRRTSSAGKGIPGGYCRVSSSDLPVESTSLLWTPRKDKRRSFAQPAHLPVSARRFPPHFPVMLLTSLIISAASYPSAGTDSSHYQALAGENPRIISGLEPSATSFSLRASTRFCAYVSRAQVQVNYHPPPLVHQLSGGLFGPARRFFHTPVFIPSIFEPTGCVQEYFRQHTSSVPSVSGMVRTIGC